MTYIGHPVIGDPLYGVGNRKLYDKGQLLHAYKLTFVHPRTQKEVSFEAPLPDYFQELLDKLS
jgi:23S rRNA pseudouridine1911/1915/1917 synthase